MKTDPFGIPHFSSDELCDNLYKDPYLKLSTILVDDPDEYNRSVRRTYAEFEYLQLYRESAVSVEMFDSIAQARWHMPDEYINMDIALWILNQCHSDAELQRAGQELLMFQDRDMFNLLRYTKYLVDTFRKNNVVWGLGRGSSVASFVLYKIGIHKVNSLFYEIPIEEFLK